MTRAYVLSPAGCRPLPPACAVAATLGGALAMLLMPGAAAPTGLWGPLVALFPESAPACLALAVATLTGGVAWQGAEAVARRRALRPALTAAIIAALFAPATLAVPLWPALLAAAALVALPAPRPPVAANDNPAPGDRWVNPFALAA